MTHSIKSIFAAAVAIIFSAGQVRALPLTPYQVWAIQYFGSDNSPLAAPTADPDGDGQDNMTEFIAGTNPTNGTSFWEIQASSTNGLAPFTVNFSDNVTIPAVTNRLWNFGDGGMSTGATPVYVYADPGIFSVSETLFNENGTVTLTESDLITVIPEPSTLLLVSVGLLGVTTVPRRRR